ncbi:MAG: glycosyltransferase [Propioniciclava sp.]|uniref:glycosyltransferase n=1 Tax=Propioniciclava sp. TaxID=2038686 RepID=UPI0039E425A5
MPETVPFSVLLPVYGRDEPAHFVRAVTSVTGEQTLRPSELVVVVDGPVPDGLRSVLDDLAAGRLTDQVPVTLVPLPENVGLARALTAGLEACGHEIVARADADDISLPARFARQVPLVADGLDLISAAIAEFTDDEHETGLVRTWPSDPDEIRTLATLWDPFNHPAVVFRRSAVLAAGGYQHLDRLEDYWLFARMLAHGARVGNVTEPLVLYRVGAGAYDRRGGWTLWRSEIALQRKLRGIGFTTRLQFVRNLAIRTTWRFVPAGPRRALYAALTRLRGR